MSSRARALVCFCLGALGALSSACSGSSDDSAGTADGGPGTDGGSVVALPAGDCSAQGGSEMLTLTLGQGAVLTRTSAPPGSTLLVGGRDLPPGEQIRVSLNDETLATATADDSGRFCLSVPVPATLSPDVYTFAATATPSGASSDARFAIRTDWAQPAFSASRTSYNPYENQLDGELTADFSEELVSDAVAPLGGRVIAGGSRLFAMTEAAPSGKRSIYAFSRLSGKRLWSAELPVTVQAITASSGIAATEGWVFAAGTDGLYAFAQDCTENCLPSWRGLTPSPSGPPTVYGERVYLQSGGKLLAFPLNCDGAETCEPVMEGDTGGASPLPVAVYKGLVYAFGESGGIPTVNAFAVDCESSCRPVWSAKLAASPSDGPVLAHDRLFVASGAALHAYAFDCGGAEACETYWRAEGSAFDSAPAVANQRVFVHGRPQGTAQSIGNSVAMYAVDCAQDGSACAPTWRASVPTWVAGTPALVQDIALWPGVIFSRECGSGGRACAPLLRWDAPTIGAAGVTVSDGRMFVAGSDGAVHVFAPVNQ